MIGTDHVRRFAPYLVLVMIVAGLAWVALREVDEPTEQPALHDSGIWVVNDQFDSFGRFDKSIGQLDAAYFATAGGRGDALDVRQQEAAVVGLDRAAGTLSVIDPATVDVPDGESVPLSSDAVVDLGGGTLAVAGRDDGQVRASRVDPATGRPTVTGLSSQDDPLTAAGAQSDMVVTRNGTIAVLSIAEQRLLTVPVTGGGFGEPVETELGELSEGTTLTSVGERIVLLEPDGHLQVVDGPSATVPRDAVLQQPGPAAASVVVAGADELLQVDLDSGNSEPIGGAAPGDPVAPVRLGACAYGAWAGDGGLVRTQCGEQAASDQELSRGSPTAAPAGAADLSFRVNRGQIVLNDAATGRVWDVTSDRLTSLEDWQAFANESDTSGERDQEIADAGDRQEPQAQDDEFAARPGRTSIVHPLDNDLTPPGSVLTITEVGQVTGGRAEVSPDGQVVQVELGGRGPMRFSYTISDGVERGRPITASVQVAPATGNEPPQLRPGYTAPELSVAAGAQLDIPVLGDWRDPDSDPVTLASATVAEGGGTVRPTSAGRLRFTAPPEAAQVHLSYEVADGTGGSVEELLVQVQGPTAEARSPVALPDVASGPVGEPIQVRPLANDLAGSDPGDPGATLEVSTQVDEPRHASVTTDLEAGEITLTSDRPGTYLLHYQAGFGNAAPDRGLIRVDVHGSGSGTPMTMTDTVDVHGDQPALADVLANDRDPGGAVLTVVDVEEPDPDLATATVVDGRYVRLAPTGTELPETVRLTYTVSNGAATATGELVATPRDVPANGAPVTAADSVSVRSGAMVSVPVLDNDIDPAGGRLALTDDAVADRAGALPVTDAAGVSAPEDVGVATTSGDHIRYTAPTIPEADTFTVSYVATTDTGETAPGELRVEVVPQGENNQPPTPPRLEGRVYAGGTVEVDLPGSGVDPDGDPVTITAIAEPPEHGRVVTSSADTITYQAFPDATGTDEFAYEVTDDQGAVATGTVRIGVVPRSLPQPPQAVPDELAAAPGSVMVVDVVSNDYVDGTARVSLSDDVPYASLVSEDGTLVEIEVPEDAGEGSEAGEEIVVPYELSNGAGSTTSAVTVRVEPGHNAPPVVDDVHVADGDAERVSVDLLESGFDPDGATSELSVLPVREGRAVADQNGRYLTVRRGVRDRVIPFHVRDPEGGTTTATLFVAARTAPAPEPIPDAVVEVEPGGQKVLALEDYVRDAAGGPVRLPYTDRASSTPAGVDVDILDEQRFRVRAAEGVSGPGAVSFEVAAGRPGEGGSSGIVSVPVQVGATKPILTCGDEPLELTQAATTRIDIDTLCDLWTADPADAGEIALGAEMAAGSGVDATVDGRSVQLKASSTAAGASRLDLTVEVDGTASETVGIPVEVVDAPKPTLAPVRLGDLRAGHSREVDLAPYFTSGIPGRTGTVHVAPSAPGIRTRKLGGSRIRITAADGASGTRSFRVVMTDAGPNADRVPASRRATGRVVIELLDRPDAPGAPRPGRIVRSQEVQLSWRAPDAHGAPIDRYQLRGGGRTVTCRTTSCAVDGLTNGQRYRFSVRAHNSVGWSPWSAPSRATVPDARPGAVRGIRVTRVGDGRISLAWSPPTRQTSLDGYRLSWPGGSQRVRGTRGTVRGLNNNRSYVITVQAYNNRVGIGPARRSGRAHSIGRPAAPRVPTLNHRATTSARTAVSVSWGAVRPNGPGPARYTVLRNGSVVGGCRGITRTRCQAGGIRQNGGTQRFSVRVRNAGVAGVPGGRARRNQGGTGSIRVVGRPAPWTQFSVTPSGNDTLFRAWGRVPPSRGKRSHVTHFSNGVQRKWSTNKRGRLRGKWLRTHGSAVAGDRRPYRIRLRVCNERYCRWSPERTVQTYGSLRKGHLRIAAWQSKGRVRFRVWNDGNGQAIRVRVSRWVRGRYDKSLRIWKYRNPGPGVDTRTFIRKVKCGKVVRLRVRIADGKRGEVIKIRNRKRRC